MKKRKKKKLDFLKSSFLLAFLLVALLVFWRSGLYHIHSTLTDLDTNLYNQAITLGWKSVFMPIDGSLMFLTRLLAWIGTISVENHVGDFYHWSTLVVSTFAISYFARSTFSYLIPSSLWRIITCLLLVIAPGTSEVLFSLYYLEYPLLLWAFLLLIEHPFRLNRRTLLLLVVLALSSGPSGILIPVAIYMWFHSKSWSYLAALLAFVPITAINVYDSYLLGDLRLSQINHTNFINGLQLFAENFYSRVLLAPIFGYKLTYSFMHLSPSIFWISFSIGLIALFFFFKRLFPLEMFERIFNPLSVCVLASLVVYSLAAISPSFFPIADRLLLKTHFSYITGSLCLILWTMICYYISSWGHLIRRIVGLFLFILIIINTLVLI